ncbi:hypothetical protein [Aquisphaera insulae]|uniref:hypothetical protein n=1 Tax=Aquisphaera insulae TaxID=2712864 RepID=UPI0013E9C75D|nr:hypothetical protein [Aquisphaera insulae]
MRRAPLQPFGQVRGLGVAQGGGLAGGRGGWELMRIHEMLAAARATRTKKGDSRCR